MTAHVMSTADPKDRSLPTTVEDQTRRTLENIKACVEAANGTMADIYKVVVMLKDPRDYRKMNTVRAEYFVKEPPVSTCFRADLMSPDILVEIEAAAYVPQADG